jgi:adenine-specific DNA-methyltransferase
MEPHRNDLAGTLLANIEHIQPGRSDTDVLYELLLKLGLDLCVPIEARPIAGKTVRSIGGGVLMACLEPRIAVSEAEALALGMAAWRKEQAPAGDTTAVFRDSAFENDVAKSNLAAILQQHGIAKYGACDEQTHQARIWRWRTDARGNCSAFPNSSSRG